MNVPVSMSKVPDFPSKFAGILSVATPVPVITSVAEGFPDSIKLPLTITSFVKVPSKIFPFCHRIIPLPFFKSLLLLLVLFVISPT